MAPDTADLILEDLVVESGFKFTLALGSSSDVSGLLATTQDDEILFRGKSGCVKRGVSNKGLENLKVVHIDYLEHY